MKTCILSLFVLNQVQFRTFELQINSFLKLIMSKNHQGKNKTFEIKVEKKHMLFSYVFFCRGKLFKSIRVIYLANKVKIMFHLICILAFSKNKHTRTIKHRINNTLVMHFKANGNQKLTVLQYDVLLNYSR